MFEKKELVDLIGRLVSIPSPYFEEEEIMQLVERWLKDNELDCRVHEFHEAEITGFKGKNLVVELKGDEEGPVICLNGHLDSVQLCNGWTRDPYKGEIEGDRLYGLGALDMKSGCAAILMALAEFRKRHSLFRGRIIATLVSGEEGPYGLGTNALIEEGYLKDVDVSIITEPSAGFTKNPFPVVCLGARGGYGLEIEIFGKSAHAAMPEEGISAALDAARLICELENVDYIRHEELGTGTACVVAVESDGGACSVPDYARIKLFWHIVVGENEDTIRKEIEKAVRRAGIQSTYKINFREAPSPDSRGFLPFTVSRQDPFVAGFLDTVEQICGEEPKIDYFQSIGDFNYLGSRIDAPAIIFGPSGENFHSHDEYVDLDSAEKTAVVLLQYLEKLLVD
jgi:succinyl-diaminopimelate desuccinylase